jgi:hypothetical protein
MTIAQQVANLVEQMRPDEQRLVLYLARRIAPDPDDVLSADDIEAFRRAHAACAKGELVALEELEDANI